MLLEAPGARLVQEHSWLRVATVRRRRRAISLSSAGVLSDPV
jgi:hypothetical protein